MNNKLQLYVRTDKSLSVKYNISRLPLYIREEKLSDFRNMQTEYHWNDDMTCLYVRRGSMSVVIDGESIVLNAGEQCIINSGCFHYFSHIDHQDCTYYCGLLNESLFSNAECLQEKYFFPIFHAFHPNYAILRSDNPYYKEIIRLFDKMGELLIRQPPAYDLFLTARLHDYVALLALALPPEFFLTIPQSNEDSSTFFRMLSFIQEHYSESVLVSDIADSGNISKRHCYAMFYRYTGKSPANYLMEYRLKISRRLLTSGNMSLSEIALSCGFSHQSHFTRCFTKAYGMTPKKYRSPKSGTTS